MCGDRRSPRTSPRSSALRSLESRLRRRRHPKRPEAFDIRKKNWAASREASVKTADFAADQPVDRIGFCFAELDFGGARRHQRGADASARGGLLILDCNALVVQAG
jgi:hypothetical protein